MTSLPQTEAPASQAPHGAGLVRASSGDPALDTALAAAAALARIVATLRKSAEPGEHQKAALHALVDLAAEQSFTFRHYDGTVTIDGVPIPTSDPRLAELAWRLSAQSVAEIAIAKGAEPVELLALAMGLAEEPGSGRLKGRLRDANSTRVMVVAAPALNDTHQAVSITGAFAKLKCDEEHMAAWQDFLLHGARSANDRNVDIGLATPPPLPPPVTPPSPPPPPLAAPEAAPQSAPQPAPPARASRPTLQVATPLSVAWTMLVADPYGAEVLTTLNIVARRIEDALEGDMAPEAIDVWNWMIELESQAPELARQKYDAILRRILTHGTLAQVAPFLLDPRRKGRAATILMRGGEHSVGMLAQLFEAAATLAERLAFLEVLRVLPRGLDRVLVQLCRQEWLVVRNAAEACGEANVGEAVTYLARLLQHADERVHRTALVALAKIGTAMTIEPLKSELAKGSAELRALVVSSINGPHAHSLTPLLVDLMARERRADVIRACCLALGRIGTPAAYQALERAACRRGWFSRRVRLARRSAREALSFRTIPAAAPVRNSGGGVALPLPG